MAGVMLDITERKRTEARLQEVLRLEAIGRLAGGIAHDLNNMLVAILGFSDLLAGSFQPDDPRREDAEQITLAASRSANLTRQLLAFARREIIQPRRMDINGWCSGPRECCDRYWGRTSSCSSSWHLTWGDLRRSRSGRTDPDEPRAQRPGCDAAGRSCRDRDREARPRRRLVGPAGRVGGIAGTLHHAGRERHRDGMDPATLQRIWEPFFTTKPSGRGTGLGLAAVYGSVKQSGGFVWAESAPGQGTVISVYWPEGLLTEEQLADSNALPPGQPGTETILVVEDEPLVRSLTVRTLGRLGYRCFVAERAEHALRMVKNHELHPDLVITDVVLPGMSGGWLAEQLSQALPGLPMLFMSGFTAKR
jgi:hypothetical protein